MGPNDKAAAAHVDTIKPSSGGNSVKFGHHEMRANEEIIQHLQTTGEEVGMTWRTTFAATSMAMCYNAYLFTLLIPPAILSFINAELGPDPRYTWITISWNLGGAMFVTVGGRLSDIFGRRYFFLTGAIILIIGSIVSATGKSIYQMIAGGALFGAGSGFLEMAFGAVQEIVPNRYRIVTIGLFDASSIIAQIMPLVAWVIIKNTKSWRNAYYMMIGFQALNFILLFFFYHPPSFKEKRAKHGKSRRQLLVDLYPWTGATTLAPIIVGFMTLVGLGFYEAYGNLKEPLFPPRLFKAVQHFTVPMLTRLSQLLYASDEISKGLYAEVLPLGSVIGGIVVAFSKKIGHQRWQVTLAVALQTACVGAMSTATLDNPVKSIILTFFISLCTSINILNGMVLVGFGIVYQEDIGTAAGLAGTSRLLAGAVATAIFSNVTNNKYTEVLPGRVRANVKRFNLSADTLKKLIPAARVGSAAAYKAVPGITPAIQAAAALGNKQAYLIGAHLSYQVALAFGVCGVIAAFFIPSVDKRKYTKKTVAVQQADRKALEEKKVTGA
ncbi:MFS general substrate transporter [Zopfia rhizophila CBS 207.26]|uniref:MFS general substrate transporter n=1 Tax=Zopfia rhizophila CBS 207.26 TaxID=1314779 RepID=A0A6A6ESL7_9PEZI|nr:MFS general substrate transporter [Zopfia rhizophila CBS 207.26]